MLDRGFKILNPIQTWNMSDIKVIELTQGCGKPLRLSVNSFSQSTLNTGGLPTNVRSIFEHPYGFVDLEETENGIKAFINANVGDYVLGKVDRSDQVTTLIFNMTYRLCLKVTVSLVLCK